MEAKSDVCALQRDHSLNISNIYLTCKLNLPFLNAKDMSRTQEQLSLVNQRIFVLFLQGLDYFLCQKMGKEFVCLQLCPRNLRSRLRTMLEKVRSFFWKNEFSCSYLILFLEVYSFCYYYEIFSQMQDSLLLC